MNRIVETLNNRYLLAVIAGLFVLGLIKRVGMR
jgi:hypothetical protein